MSAGSYCVYIMEITINRFFQSPLPCVGEERVEAFTSVSHRIFQAGGTDNPGQEGLAHRCGRQHIPAIGDEERASTGTPHTRKERELYLNKGLSSLPRTGTP